MEWQRYRTKSQLLIEGIILIALALVFLGWMCG